MKNMYFVHNDKHFWTDKSMYISLTFTLRKSYHNHKRILNFVSGERIHYQIQHGCPMAGPSLVCIRIWLHSSRHLLGRTRDVQKRLSYMLLFTYCKASFASFAYAKWVVDYCLSLALHIFFSNKLFLFVVNNKSLFIYIFFQWMPSAGPSDLPSAIFQPPSFLLDMSRRSRRWRSIQNRGCADGVLSTFVWLWTSRGEISMTCAPCSVCLSLDVSQMIADSLGRNKMRGPIGRYSSRLAEGRALQILCIS